MLILALEVSARDGAVAVWQDGNILAAGFTPPETRSAGSLAPLVKTMLAEAQSPIENVDAVAVSIGPGSFTGLRIGLTLAKTLAYSLKIPVIGVDSLAALARRAKDCIPNLGHETVLVTSCLGAQRGDLFSSSWTVSPSGWNCQTATSIVSAVEWLESRQAGEILLGLGLAELSDEQRESLTLKGCVIAPESCWTPVATTIAEIASERLTAGDVDDPFALKPLYLRPSYAEEKRAAKD